MCKAEASKSQILDPKGNIYSNHVRNNNLQDNRNVRRDQFANLDNRRVVQHDNGYESDKSDDREEQGRQLFRPTLTEVDQDYVVVGNFVEDSVRQRIENGEYINFVHLLPRDRLALEEDNRMEKINKNGKTYFVPTVDLETGGISKFSRWEQAFRVFSNIYTRR